MNCGRNTETAHEIDRPDVGGTFTDLIFFDLATGALGTHKVSTTHEAVAATSQTA